MTFQELPIATQGLMLMSCAIAFGWMLSNVFIVMIGYYLRDRSLDE